MSMRKSKRGLIGVVAILFLLILDFGSVDAQLADSPWPMLHGNLRHTGLSPYNTTHVDGTVKWTFETGAGIESSPTIAPDGTIYIGSHDNKLYAINPDGTLKWKFNAGEPVYIEEWDVWKGIPSAPTIDKNGTIYFVAPPIYMFALNPDGTEKWRYPVYTSAHIGASPVIVPDGTIYIGSESYPHAHGKDAPNKEFGARVYALNPDGTLKWRYDTNGACLANPIAIASDGTIYVSGSDLNQEPPITNEAVFAFYPNGTIKWKSKTDRIEGPPTIAEDGTIYVGTKSGKFLALNPDGSQKWIFQADKGISALAALGKDKTIYIGSWDGNFYALNPEGKELWRFDTKKGRDPKIFESPYMETITSSAVISADGTIYFGDIIDTFYALDLNGKEKWRYKAKGGFVSSPAIGPDGTVYVGSWDHNVYAFGGSPKEKIIIQEKEDEQLKEVAVNDTKETEQSKKIPLDYIAIAVMVIVMVGIVIVLKKRGLKT